MTQSKHDFGTMILCAAWAVKLAHQNNVIDKLQHILVLFETVITEQ